MQEEPVIAQYAAPLVWLGTWPSPTGLMLNGFHVWDREGQWVGVYDTCHRASAEAIRA
jgi:hypothetical protein